MFCWFMIRCKYSNVMFMDDRIQPILWSYKTRCLASHMTTSAVYGEELSGRAVLLRTDLQPRGGKKRWGPDENNCFCCYLATTDRHMLYIALSIANWCSVMTTTCISALKVYLTWYPTSKFKDVFARSRGKESREKMLFPVVSQRLDRLLGLQAVTHRCPWFVQLSPHQ